LKRHAKEKACEGRGMKEGRKEGRKEERKEPFPIALGEGFGMVAACLLITLGHERRPNVFEGRR
jgi:hypothetical protein